MAERIEALPARSRPAKYPWDEWLDGSAWVARRGVDYRCSCDTLMTQLRLAARRHGVKVRVRKVDLDGVAWQTYLPGERRPARTGEHAWDVGAYQALVDEWVAGRSASDVARALGRSRGAVTTRLGLLRKSGVPVGRRASGQATGRPGGWLEEPGPIKVDQALVDRVNRAR